MASGPFRNFSSDDNFWKAFYLRISDSPKTEEGDDEEAKEKTDKSESKSLTKSQRKKLKKQSKKAEQEIEAKKSVKQVGAKSVAPSTAQLAHSNSVSVQSQAKAVESVDLKAVKKKKKKSEEKSATNQTKPIKNEEPDRKPKEAEEAKSASSKKSKMKKKSDEAKSLDSKNSTKPEVKKAESTKGVQVPSNEAKQIKRLNDISDFSDDNLEVETKPRLSANKTGPSADNKQAENEGDWVKVSHGNEKKTLRSKPAPKPTPANSSPVKVSSSLNSLDSFNDEKLGTVDLLIPSSIDEEEIMLRKALELSLKETSMLGSADDKKKSKLDSIDNFSDDSFILKEATKVKAKAKILTAIVSPNSAQPFAQPTTQLKAKAAIKPLAKSPTKQPPVVKIATRTTPALINTNLTSFAAATAASLQPKSARTTSNPTAPLLPPSQSIAVKPTPPKVTSESESSTGPTWFQWNKPETSEAKAKPKVESVAPMVNAAVVAPLIQQPKSKFDSKASENQIDLLYSEVSSKVTLQPTILPLLASSTSEQLPASEAFLPLFANASNDNIEPPNSFFTLGNLVPAHDLSNSIQETTAFNKNISPIKKPIGAERQLAVNSKLVNSITPPPNSAILPDIVNGSMPMPQPPNPMPVPSRPTSAKPAAMVSAIPAAPKLNEFRPPSPLLPQSTSTLAKLPESTLGAFGSSQKQMIRVQPQQKVTTQSQPAPLQPSQAELNKLKQVQQQQQTQTFLNNILMLLNTNAPGIDQQQMSSLFTQANQILAQIQQPQQPTSLPELNHQNNFLLNQNQFINPIGFNQSNSQQTGQVNNYPWSNDYRGLGGLLNQNGDSNPGSLSNSSLSSMANHSTSSTPSPYFPSNNFQSNASQFNNYSYFGSPGVPNLIKPAPLQPAQQYRPANSYSPFGQYVGPQMFASNPLSTPVNPSGSFVSSSPSLNKIPSPNMFQSQIMRPQVPQAQPPPANTLNRQTNFEWSQFQTWNFVLVISFFFFKQLILNPTASHGSMLHMQSK